VLERNGIPHTGLDRGQASGLIDALIKRRERGDCTFKQARILLKFGLDPDVSFAEATQQINHLAANGWRR